MQLLTRQRAIILKGHSYCTLTMEATWMKKLTVSYTSSALILLEGHLTSVHYALDKQILDGVQIAKDIERSLYYYPQGM
jgi:hypothetical protein